MSAAGYLDFLARKQPAATLAGIEPPAMPGSLFPFQSDLTRWALRRGRAAVFADTGLGKTRVELVWAHALAPHVGRTIILAPLAVASQTVREGERIGIPVTLCRTGADVRPGINVTNYDMLHAFDPSAFGAVVLDECFAAGTPVTIVQGDGPNARLVTVPIEDVRVGARIYNASGFDVVSDVHRREVQYAVRVTIDDRRIIASPNHPVFTQRGWVAAQDLIPGDGILDVRTAVRLVRFGVSAAVQEGIAAQAAAVLRALLLSEMADEPPGPQGEGAHAGDPREDRCEGLGLVEVRDSISGGEPRTHPGAQPDAGREDAGEGIHPIARDEARTFRAWGQRSWFDRATGDLAGCTRRDVGAGVQLITGPTDSGLSNALQDRLGSARAANRYRSGWVLPSQPQGSGREEGCSAPFARVDGLEVLESGHPELERLRSTDGKLYFYDLGGTRHPSFAVAGLLVHNSSCLKDFTSATRNRLIESFAATPYKLACTATPAPNDFTELGNHAEFLGILSRTEMLASWFVHDGSTTQDWRLKGHAAQDFWRWVCSWAALVKTPSDLGYPDDGYILPELRMHDVVVASSQETARQQGRLFVEPARTLQEQRAARRASLGERVRACAEIVNASESPFLVWCELNDEGKALVKAIPGAVEVAGVDKLEEKERRLFDFAEGRTRALVTKPSIASQGLNLQVCSQMAYVGLSHSWEEFYQSVRRCYRFGQLRPVDVYIITSEAEGRVTDNLRRKEADAASMGEEMRRQTRAFVQESVHGARRELLQYETREPVAVPWWLVTDETGSEARA